MATEAGARQNSNHHATACDEKKWTRIRDAVMYLPAQSAATSKRNEEECVMPLKLVLAFATLAFLPFPTEAQEKGGSDSVRDSCREEARLSIKKDRTNKLDRDQMRELRREYAKNCRRKAKAG